MELWRTDGVVLGDESGLKLGCELDDELGLLLGF
jgi:hypothetical protein